MAEEDKKEETPAEVKEETKAVEIPEKFKSLVSEIEKLTALELSELVKVLEGHFGVSAAAPVAMVAGGAAGGDAGAVEEKDEFTVELANAGSNKIAVIKVVREVTGKGLKDVKDLVEAAPVDIKENLPKKEAEELKAKLEEAGGTVNLK